MANDLALVHAHLWRLLTKVKFFLIFFPDQCISLIPGKFVKLPFKYFMFLMACLYRMTVASSSMVIFEVFFFLYSFFKASSLKFLWRVLGLLLVAHQRKTTIEKIWSDHWCQNVLWRRCAYKRPSITHSSLHIFFSPRHPSYLSQENASSFLGVWVWISC